MRDPRVPTCTASLGRRRGLGVASSGFVKLGPDIARLSLVSPPSGVLKQKWLRLQTTFLRDALPAAQVHDKCEEIEFLGAPARRIASCF